MFNVSIEFTNRLIKISIFGMEHAAVVSDEKTFLIFGMKHTAVVSDGHTAVISDGHTAVVSDEKTFLQDFLVILKRKGGGISCPLSPHMIA